MKLFIFGCGVIGSIYASRFSQAGYDVTVYARGRRLEELQTHGLLVRIGSKVRKIPVTVTDDLKGNYDYAFVTVKYEQLIPAIHEIAQLHCDNIVTMVNNPEGYAKCEKILEAGRLIPAFPGAGGVIEDGILKADFTPAVIQKTTYGEIDGSHTKRIILLKDIFLRSGIPAERCDSMIEWQLCHLGLVVPLADAIYRGGGDNFTAGKKTEVMLRAAREIRRNLSILKKSGTTLFPSKMNLFVTIPPKVVASCLSLLYRSDFGTQFIYGHSMKAVTEMMALRRAYYKILKERI